MELTARRRGILIGAISVLVLVALVSIGIKASFGAFRGGYELHGTFAAAGQGLLPGSDVKVRGVNVGEVRRIELVENRALLTFRIDGSTEIPETAAAVIRPKSLFGEKFVDIDLGPDEATGPYLADGGEITNTLGGFELEQVLADAYPVLKAIDPVELAVVFDELADAGSGLGETINRTIVNSATLADLQASNDAEVRQFLGDLALLSEELDQLSPALVEGARDLSVALPTLTEHADDLSEALEQTGRLAGDLADLIANNKGFIDTVNTVGGDSVQLLYDKRKQLVPLVEALNGYTQAQLDIFRFEVGDGTLMAAVKGLVSPSGLLATVGGSLESEPPVEPPVPLPPVPDVPLDAPVLDDLLDILSGNASTNRSTSSPTSGGSILDILLGGRG